MGSAFSEANDLKVTASTFAVSCQSSSNIKETLHLVSTKDLALARKQSIRVFNALDLKVLFE